MVRYFRFQRPVLSVNLRWKCAQDNSLVGATDFQLQIQSDGDECGNRYVSLNRFLESLRPY